MAGEARLGWARQGMARCDTDWQVWQSKVGHGRVGHGMAGVAWMGAA